MYVCPVEQVIMITANDFLRPRAIWCLWKSWTESWSNLVVEVINPLQTSGH